jgi:hypothetical protein
MTGILLALGGLAIRPSEATIGITGAHWAHGESPARIGVMVAGDLDRQLIANVVAEYDKLENIEIGVVAETPTAEECAINPVNIRYGYIAVCRWEFTSGGHSSKGACGFEGWAATDPRCQNHRGFSRLDLPRANYPYYPNMICHELGHALGLDHGGNGCMTTHGWANRNLGYCPGSIDMGELEALHAHDDGYVPNYTVGPFVEVGQDYGCPAPPFYDTGSGQEWTVTPTPQATPIPPTNTPQPPTATPIPLTNTPTSVPTPTPCLPANAQRCRR